MYFLCKFKIQYNIHIKITNNINRTFENKKFITRVKNLN